MSKNIVFREEGFEAPGGLDRNQGSFYTWIKNGLTYEQTGAGNNRQWVEVNTGADLPYSVYTALIDGLRNVSATFFHPTGFNSFIPGNEYIIGSVAAGGTGILSTGGGITNPAFIGAPLIVGEMYTIASPFQPSLFGDDFSNVGFVALDVPWLCTGTTPTAWAVVPPSAISYVAPPTPDDFTNINFVALDVPFIATGTTPTAWGGLSEVVDLTLSFASTNVLQNNMGAVVLDDNDFIPGYYVDIKSPGLFIKDKTWLNMASTGAVYRAGVGDPAQGSTLQWIDVNTIRLSIRGEGIGLDKPDYTKDIEIRIYK